MDTANHSCQVSVLKHSKTSINTFNFQVKLNAIKGNKLGSEKLHTAVLSRKQSSLNSLSVKNIWCVSGSARENIPVITLDFEHT